MKLVMIFYVVIRSVFLQKIRPPFRMAFKCAEAHLYLCVKTNYKPSLNTTISASL